MKYFPLICIIFVSSGLYAEPFSHQSRSLSSQPSAAVSTIPSFAEKYVKAVEDLATCKVSLVNITAELSNPPNVIMKISQSGWHEEDKRASCLKKIEASCKNGILGEVNYLYYSIEYLMACNARCRSK